jgi:TolB-like protein/Flp pilus assembly protein TadD
VGSAVENNISETAIRQELSRILKSPMFAQSERLARFLRYTVDCVIAGQEESLKEYVIGTDVYDRKPPYHPSLDSIVRTEARRLRSKLKEYYEVEGKDDPIFIFFRPGSYVPVFRKKDSETTYQVVVDNHQPELFVQGPGVAVAVIPFVDLSGQPLSAKYALGVTDELIHELMQSEGCRVISASSVIQLGQAVDAQSLAQKLGVQVVFEGTVRTEGNRVRVTARIVNADGFQLWSQRLDAEGDLTNGFNVQEQFASAMVSRVRPQQSAIMALKSSTGPLLLAVYPTLLKAEALLEDNMIPDFDLALAKFREVAQAAPQYARAYCGIARCHLWMAFAGAPWPQQHCAQARVAAERAVKLDPRMADALTSIATVQALEWQWEAAEASFRKAAEHRSHAAAGRQFAMLLTALGRFDEACQQIEHAQRIDPFCNLQKAAHARFYYQSRRYEEGVEQMTEPLRYGPIPLAAQLYLGLIYAGLDKPEPAMKIAQHAQRCGSSQPVLLGWIAEIFARAGDLTTAQSICNKHALLAADAGMSRYRQARLAVALGNSSHALSLLLASYAEREPELGFLAVEPGFDAVRATPEFNEIADRVGVLHR